MPCIMEIPQPHFFINNIKYKGYKVQNSNIQCKKNQDELRSTVEMDITVLIKANVAKLALIV